MTDAGSAVDAAPTGVPSSAASELLRTAMAAVPEAEGASILLRGPRGGLRLWASSTPLGECWDEVQLAVREGPGWECSSSGSDVFVDDLHAPDWAARWPALACAAPAGVRSLMVLQLESAGCRVGCLTVHSHVPAAFDVAAQGVAGVVATVGAQTVVVVLQNDGLHTALHHRDVIGQAKGIVMERLRLDADRAFDVLRIMSHQTNTKLVEVARDIALTGVTTKAQADVGTRSRVRAGLVARPVRTDEQALSRRARADGAPGRARPPAAPRG